MNKDGVAQVLLVGRHANEDFTFTSQDVFDEAEWANLVDEVANRQRISAKRQRDELEKETLHNFKDGKKIPETIAKADSDIEKAQKVQTRFYKWLALNGNATLNLKRFARYAQIWSNGNNVK